MIETCKRVATAILSRFHWTALAYLAIGFVALLASHGFVR